MKHPLEKHISNAIEEAPIHLLEKIKNQPVPKMETHDYITRQEKEKKQRKWRIPAFAFTAMFIAFFVLWVMPLYTVEGSLYVDMNPSTQISYNRRRRYCRWASNPRIKNSSKTSPLGVKISMP